MECEKLCFSQLHLPEVDSTNRYIRDEAARLWIESNGADALLVTAGYQTDGRGQRGNRWTSVAGENLLLSILVRPSFLAVKEQFLLSQVAALSVKHCLHFFEISSLLKWPNDIYVGNRKICGMLVELDYMGNMLEQAVIGIGINVNQMVFEKMSKLPVSIKMLTGQSFSVAEVKDVFLTEFSNYYRLLQLGDYATIRNEYKQSLMGCCGMLTYVDAGGEFMAAIKDVCDDGILVLQRKDGTVGRYAFKEVELLL